jgi:hypothetical protein
VPQIPILNPRERMVHQALSGFPGIRAPSFEREDGSVEIDLSLDEETLRTLKSHLNHAFTQPANQSAFEFFLPKQEDYRCLRPLLWEASERGKNQVKLQLAGPWTSLKSLRPSTPEQGAVFPPQIKALLFEFILARALSLLRVTAQSGAKPLLFIDEPYLFALQPKTHPLDQVVLKELQFFFEVLRKEARSYGGEIGLHCCSDPDWTEVLTHLPIDHLSVDASVSLHSLTGVHPAAMTDFLNRGGKVVWGVVPSNHEQSDIEIPVSVLEKGPNAKSGMITPACGLAYHTPLECEDVLSRLHAAQARLNALFFHSV